MTYGSVRLHRRRLLPPAALPAVLAILLLSFVASPVAADDMGAGYAALIGIVLMSVFLIVGGGLGYVVYRQRKSLRRARRGAEYRDADEVALDHVGGQQPGSEEHGAGEHGDGGRTQSGGGGEAREEREGRGENDNGNAEAAHDEEDEEEEEEEKRLPGVPIENRVRPRTRPPKGTVVVQYEDRRIRINFGKLPDIPEADPPPLTAEELQRLEDERNRIASPEFYGRADYLERRASAPASPVEYLGSNASFRHLDALRAAAAAAGSHYGGSHYAASNVSAASINFFGPHSPTQSPIDVRQESFSDSTAGRGSSISPYAFGGGGGQPHKHAKPRSNHNSGSPHLHTSTATTSAAAAATHTASRVGNGSFSVAIDATRQRRQRRQPQGNGPHGLATTSADTAGGGGGGGGGGRTVEAMDSTSDEFDDTDDDYDGAAAGTVTPLNRKALGNVRHRNHRNQNNNNDNNNNNNNNRTTSNYYSAQHQQQYDMTPTRRTSQCLSVQSTPTLGSPALYAAHVGDNRAVSPYAFLDHSFTNVGAAATAGGGAAGCGHTATTATASNYTTGGDPSPHVAPFVSLPLLDHNGQRHAQNGGGGGGGVAAAAGNANTASTAGGYGGSAAHAVGIVSATPGAVTAAPVPVHVPASAMPSPPRGGVVVASQAVGGGAEGNGRRESAPSPLDDLFSR